MTWVPGTTQLHDLGHTPSLSGTSFPFRITENWARALQILAGNESNLEMQVLVTTT